MADDKKPDNVVESQSLKSQGDRVADGKVENVEATAARQASGTEVKQALDTNPNKHSGSAGGDPRYGSIEIDFGGGKKATKETGLTEAAASNLKATPLDEDGRPIVSPAAPEVNQHFYKVELNYQQLSPEAKDIRTPYDKLCDFAKAAGARATDPKGWQEYIDGEIELGKGIWSGLNKTKEHIKSMPGEVAEAFQDGRVANFLSHPENLKDPICKLLGGALWASTHGPEFNRLALTAVGTAIVKGSAEYSKLDKFHKGEVVGDTMFAFINPSGSTEGGELALQIADKTATNVDTAVTSCMTQMKSCIETWKITSPERAQAMNQIMEDLSNCIYGKPMRPALAGNVPENFLNRPQSIPKVDDNPNVLKMEGQGSQKAGEANIKKPKSISDSLPSALFERELAKVIDTLTPYEKEFLAKHNIEIKAVKRICEATDTGSQRAAACYDRGEKVILVAEEVLEGREWKRSFDLSFMLKHEFGHAYNDLKFKSEDWLSNNSIFRQCYKKDLEQIMKEAPYIFSGTKLDSKAFNAEAIRDEVFADLYAHSSGLTTRSEYSQRILKYFKNCADYMKNRTYDQI